MTLNKIKVNDTTTVNTGVVYDITKATSQSYDSLSAALGTDGNNVPSEVREGGMSIRFVQTSDNKYVQYRLMSTSFSTNEADWQGVDDDLFQSMENLVKDKAVTAELIKISGKYINLNFTSKWQTKQLGYIIKSGSKVKNIGTMEVYLNEQVTLSVNSTITLDRDITFIKSSVSGSADILVYGELINIKYAIDDINGYTIPISFTFQYQTKNIERTLNAGQKVKNIGTMEVYLNGQVILPVNGTLVLDGNINTVKSSAIGEAEILVYGKITYLQENLASETEERIENYKKIIGEDMVLDFTDRFQTINLGRSLPIGTIIENKQNIIYFLYNSQNQYIELYGNGIKELSINVVKIKCGEAGTADFRIWGKLDEIKYNENYPLSLNIFHKIGCIGDSYTSGHIQLEGGEVYDFNHDYAWPHYLEKITGSQYLNFGVSGSSAKTWVNTLFVSKGIAAKGNKCQAYIIGLGINDAGSWNPDRVDAGTIEDIGTDNNTFTAWYYKLVQLVIGVNDKAKIFLLTEPRYGDNNYNQAIRNVFDYCRNAEQNVFLGELTQYNTYDYWKNPIFIKDATNAHYTAVGYHFMAQSLHKILSKVINDRVTAFKDVFQIPYDS